MLFPSHNFLKRLYFPFLFFHLIVNPPPPPHTLSSPLSFSFFYLYLSPFFVIPFSSHFIIRPLFHLSLFPFSPLPLFVFFSNLFFLPLSLTFLSLSLPFSTSPSSFTHLSNPDPPLYFLLPSPLFLSALPSIPSHHSLFLLLSFSSFPSPLPLFPSSNPSPFSSPRPSYPSPPTINPLAPCDPLPPSP